MYQASHLSCTAHAACIWHIAIDTKSDPCHAQSTACQAHIHMHQACIASLMHRACTSTLAHSHRPRVETSNVMHIASHAKLNYMHKACIVIQRAYSPVPLASFWHKACHQLITTQGGRAGICFYRGRDCCCSSSLFMHACGKARGEPSLLMLAIVRTERTFPMSRI